MIAVAHYLTIAYHHHFPWVAPMLCHLVHQNATLGVRYDSAAAHTRVIVMIEKQPLIRVIEAVCSII